MQGITRKAHLSGISGLTPERPFRHNAASMNAPRPALLLIGPTGSGKSPLGDALERATGWAHFDFGARLRLIAAGRDDHGLDADAVAFVQSLLEEHALFPDDRFPIVAQILQHFLDHHADAPGVILNGLPRHTGQAAAIAPLLTVQRVVLLDCPPKVVAERILKRKQGLTSDHADRADDTPEAIKKKIVLFHDRTRPLVAHYREQGVEIVTCPISTETHEEELLARVTP